MLLAEKSFRAALACEGKDANGKEPPPQIAEQNWWKKRTATPQPAAAGGGAKGAVPQSKSSTSAKAPSTATKPQPAKPGASKPAAAPAPAKGRQPVKPVAGPVGGRGRGATSSATNKPAGPAGRGKAVATLGDLKSGGQKQPQKTTPQATAASASKQTEKSPEKPPSETKPNEGAEKSPNKPAVLNEISYIPRLGLARALAKQDTPKDECITFYEEVIKMAGHVHDAYIELGDLLSKTEPIKAVDVYSKFPFSDPPSFDDAYLHGEIVRILMKGGLYDDPRLVTSMIAMGRALGIGVLDRHVTTLEAKFKTSLLKQVYAGVHGKSVDDPDLQTFFKFKCWT